MSDNSSKSIGKLFLSGDIRDRYIEEIGGKTGKSIKDAPVKYSFIPSRGIDDRSSKNLQHINIFPSAFETFLENDVGWNTATNNMSYDTFLRQLPCVKIRAYMPDSAIQFISNVFDTISAGIKYGLETSNEEFYNTVAKKLNTTVDAIKNWGTSLFKLDTYSIVSRGLMNDFPKALYFRTENRSITDTSILDIPYNLYFRLLGSTTNAIYELPCDIKTFSMRADGSVGWSDAGNKPLDKFGTKIINSITNKKSNKGSKKDSSQDVNQKSEQQQQVEAQQKTALGKIIKDQAIGALANSILNKTGCPTMPHFSISSSKLGGQTITVDFTLVNDSYTAAEQNFAFIQTLIANNKYLQHGFFMTPSNLYDITIPGYSRFFMCTATATVTNVGQTRRSIKPLGVFGKETRIPDAYAVSMKFNSLLPDNFNTTIMGILKSNEDIITRNDDRRVGSVEGDFMKVIPKIITTATSLEQYKNKTMNEQLAKMQEKFTKTIFPEQPSSDGKTPKPDPAEKHTKPKIIKNEDGSVIVNGVVLTPESYLDQYEKLVDAHYRELLDEYATNNKSEYENLTSEELNTKMQELYKRAHEKSNEALQTRMQEDFNEAKSVDIVQF